ncbi:uncharacterized protein LOC132559143 [Ylistrum balloti]|uniref:uncharacterized protein LOC132559143 n=1 Tax=Ylistrum balloti TaxID=509963 RepID=UPI002905B61A|nr:uncharacterized protein LOC132559143 [Ylistrum balloti]
MAFGFHILRNSRIVSQVLTLQKGRAYRQIKGVIQSYQGQLSQQIEYFRPIMEEPSIVLAAESDVDEVDLQKVMSKIRRKMKRSLQQDCEGLTEDKQTCDQIDTNISIPSVLTDSTLHCDKGNNTGSSIHESPLNHSSTNASNVGETSHTSTGEGSGKEKKKRKLSSRLQRILNHHLDKKVKKSCGDITHSQVKSSTDSSVSDICSQNSNENEVIDKKIKQSIPPVNQYLALDCEFVGVGIKGSISRLGRCSIVDYYGNIVYDMYSSCEELITDYRTKYSGIRQGHMVNALPFEVVQKTVKDLLKDKILVGHDVGNDLRVMKIEHPAEMIRDTLHNPVMKRKVKELGCERNNLRELSWRLLGRRIQSHTHCSVEDATATMDIFKLAREEWEESLSEPNPKSKKYMMQTQHTQHSQLACSMEDNGLSEYLKDKFWPKDHVTENMYTDSDSSDESVQTEASQDPVALLNEICQKLQWSDPLYSSKLQPKFICKLVVNGEEFESKACSTEWEARSSAAEAFFAHHRISKSDTNTDVFVSFTGTTPKMEYKTSQSNQSRRLESKRAILHEFCVRQGWEIPEYYLVSVTEVNLNKKFVYKVIVNGYEFQGKEKVSNRQARENAAKLCLSVLKRTGYIIQ